MDISKMKGSELQQIYKSGLALRVPKEVLSFDPESGNDVQQFIPLFIGEPGYVEALAAGAPKWDNLTLIKSPKTENLVVQHPPRGPKKAA